MNEITVTIDAIRVPNGDSTSIINLDMVEVRTLEARKDEVATINKLKAPELMRAMEKGYSIVATTLLPRISYELSVAEQCADERKAVVMLDMAPQILKDKGLLSARNPSGSIDQRENVLAMDTEYKSRRDTVEKLKAVQELLKGKMRGFEMSYGAIKKVYDSLSTYGALEKSHPGSFPLGNPIDITGVSGNEAIVGIPKYDMRK